MANPIRFFAIGLSLLAAEMLHAQIDIVKAAREANPTLVLRQVQGSATQKKLLLDTLRRCDWFAVSEGAKDPDFIVTARYDSVASGMVSLQVSSSKRGTMSLQARGPSGDSKLSTYRVVDQLLHNLFHVPGICQSRIAFAVGGRGNLKEIYTCRFDGSEARRLTHNGSISTEPSWGSKGRYLVYTLYQHNTTSIVLMDMLRNRQRRLSHFRGLNAGADLSPDGQWIALSLSKDRRVDLYLLPLQGSAPRQLTRNYAVESSPTWSPRGARLCFVSDQAGKPQLFLMSARGGTPTRLLRERDEAVSPDWSPVSNHICFSTRVGGHYAVAVVDMNNSTRQRKIVTTAAGDWESPSWAPDGRHIVCSRGLRGRRELYQVDTWHGRMIPITRNGDHSLPSWSPLLGNP